jgi:threonine/homoserine/homoserine lactone efflux protein
VADGIRIGLATGLGAATDDAAYGALAAFGLAAIAEFLTAQQFWLAPLGAVFLFYLAVRTFFAQPGGRTANARQENVAGAYASTFLLTITNPATIISFLALFSALEMSANYWRAAATVLGVFGGSALWWLLLSGTVASVRSRFDARWVRIVNQVSGIVLFAFGIYALSRTFPDRH